MVKKVKLVNWRSHLNSEFIFDKGTNGLVGILGAGKTSVLDAMCFALFGNFPTLQSKKIKLDDIIMNKPFHQKEAEVSVTFVANGKEYFVRRRIERGKGTSFAEIRENGKLLETGTKRVTELVEKILKVNYELFTKAIYSEQNSLDYFLNIPKGQRMKKIDELLRIDRFEKVRGNCVSLTNKIIERKIAIENLLSQFDIHELKKSLEEQESALKEIEEKRKSLGKRLERIREERELVQKEFEELKRIKEEFDEIVMKTNALEKAILELSESLERLGEVKIENVGLLEKQLAETKKKIENLEEEKILRKENYEKYYNEFLRSKTNLEILKKEKIELKEKELKEKLEKKEKAEKIKEIVGEAGEQKLKEKKELVEKLWNEIERVKIKISELNEQINKLSSIEGKCPICERELSKELKEKLVKERENEIKNLEGRLEEMTKKKELTEEEVKELEENFSLLKDLLEEIKDLDVLKLEIENAKKEFDELLKKTREYEEKMNLVREEFEKIEKELEMMMKEGTKIEATVSKIKEFENISQRLKELQEQRKILTKKAEELGKILKERKFEEFEEKLRKFLIEEKELQTNLKFLEKIEKEKFERKKEIEDKIGFYEKEKKKAEKLDRLIKQLKIFCKALEQTQVGLRRNFVVAVNYTMNKLWQDLYPYKDFVGIKLVIEEGDYVLKLQERSGRFINVEGIASGGERTLAALALRIAFALVLAPQLRWLVLDEPTHNLDAKAIQDLAEVLRLRIGDFVDQVFIITHEERLEHAITGMLYRLERDKSSDGITKVIKL